MIRFLRALVTPFFWFLFPTKVFHRERYKRRTKAVFAMNHRSAMDPLLALVNVSIDIHFLAKKELFNTRFKRWFFRQVHVIGVERTNLSMETMREVLGVLRRERTLGIFPEGTRNKTDVPLLPLKEGSVLFALMAKAPIVPAIIDRKVKVFRKSHILIGEPFELNEFYGRKIDREVLEQATERVRVEMLRTMEELNGILAARKRKRRERA